MNTNIKNCTWCVEVSYKSVVTDPVEDSIKKGIQDLGINVSGIKTSRKYLIKGNINKGSIERIARELLANTVVQEYKITKLKE